MTVIIQKHNTDNNTDNNTDELHIIIPFLQTIEIDFSLYSYRDMKFAVSLVATAFAVTKAQDNTQSIYDAVTSTPELSTLSTAIRLAGFEGYLTNTSDLTVFAPNNAALETLPDKFLTPHFSLHLQTILELHIVQGSVTTSDQITDFAVFRPISRDTIIATVNDQGIFFSGDVFYGSQVVGPDVMASNGVAHVIDQYFLPATLAYDLYDLATSFSGFDRVLRLIVEAGVEHEVRAENRTILAPSDQAFSFISDTTLLTQLETNSGFRNDLLRYHIILGSFPSSLISDGLEVMTALGVPMSFTVAGGGLFQQTIMAVGPINQVAVGTGDLIALNGMAHSLGGVLEVPVLSAPDPTRAPVPMSGETTPSSLPSSKPGEMDDPDEIPSVAPVMTLSDDDKLPAQSSARMLISGALMILWSSVVGFA